MSSLTSSYAGALILASMAALGAAYLGNSVPGESKAPSISPLVTPPTPEPAPAPTPTPEPAPAPSAPVSLPSLPDVPALGDRPSLTEEEARKKLRCVVSDEAIDAMFKFVKTPVKDWSQIGPTTARLSKLVGMTMTHPDKCPAVMARICALVFNKYSQMVKAIRDQPYDEVGSVWTDFAELVDELPECGDTASTGLAPPLTGPTAPLALPAASEPPSEAPLALPAPVPVSEPPAPVVEPPAPIPEPPAPAPEPPAPAPEPPAPAPEPPAPAPEPPASASEPPAPAPEPPAPAPEPPAPAPAPEPPAPAPEPPVSTPELAPPAPIVPSAAPEPPALPGAVPDDDTSTARDLLFPFGRLQRELPPAVDQTLLKQAEELPPAPINTDIYREPGDDTTIYKDPTVPSPKTPAGQGFDPLKFAQQATAYIETLRSNGTSESDIRKAQDMLVKQYEKELRAGVSRGLLSGTMANAFIGETRKKICGGRRMTARQDRM